MKVISRHICFSVLRHFFILVALCCFIASETSHALAGGWELSEYTYSGKATYEESYGVTVTKDWNNLPYPYGDPRMSPYTVSAGEGPYGVFFQVLYKHNFCPVFSLTAKTVVFLGDGAAWLWKLAETRFPKAMQILDFWHALEYVGAVVREAFVGNEEGGKEWLSARVKTIAPRRLLCRAR